MATSEHNSDHSTERDISIGAVFASREGGGSVDIEEMHQSPLEALRDYGVGTREYATAVILTLDVDIDGSPIHGVAFHHDDGTFRLRLIDQAIDALQMAREALTQARHVEQTESTWHPNLRRRGVAS